MQTHFHAPSCMVEINIALHQRPAQPYRGQSTTPMTYSNATSGSHHRFQMLRYASLFLPIVVETQHRDRTKDPASDGLYTMNQGSSPPVSCRWLYSHQLTWTLVKGLISSGIHHGITMFSPWHNGENFAAVVIELLMASTIG